MTFNKSRLASGAVLVVVTSLLVLGAACGGSGGSSASSSAGGAGSTGGSSVGGTGSGGSSSSALSATCGTTATNCATLSSDNGIAGGYVDGAFTTVTVCVPGTTPASCVNVPGVLVDTGSVGLRLLKSAVSGIALTPSKITNGDSLLECYTFVDGFIWGPVATADIQIGGETAKGAPIMLIDDSPTPAFTAPGSCVGSGSTAPSPESSQSTLGANGILGIGGTIQDCGPFCALPASQQTDGSGFAGLYYDCASVSTCTGTPLSLTAQVPNPVSQFAKDNNGTAISLPSVPSTGTVALTGALYFGIGTESNNTMPSTATVLTLNNLLNITTSYKGTANSQSFIDSGSNGYFFVDSTIPLCPDTASDPFGSSWFCPSSTLALTATNTGAAGSSSSSTVSFNVANANTLFASPNFAFSDLAGPGTAGTFDWGLPFFYGRVVYSAIEQGSATNTAGVSFAGPFVAY